MLSELTRLQLMAKLTKLNKLYAASIQWLLQSVCLKEQSTGRMLIQCDHTCDALRGPRSGGSRGEVVTVLVRRVDLNIDGIQ